MVYSLTKLTELIIKAQGSRSQNIYAKQCALSSAAISRILAGGRRPTPLTLRKLASKAYGGVTLEMLMGAAGYSEEQPSTTSPIKGHKIPVLGEIPAGIPIEAIQEIVDWEEIDEAMAGTGDYFGLVVKGDSMSPRICDGDVVIIRKQESVKSGDIAIVYVNGYNATLKKIKLDVSGISLIPLNPSFEVKFYTNQEIADIPITIGGKVVELRGKL